MIIAHIFPFDPRHLSQDVGSFLALQRDRWPLAAIAESRLAETSSAHFIGPKRGYVTLAPLPFIVHRSPTSGPRLRTWGDDWSWSLGRTIRRLHEEDVCVIHLNAYAAARYAHRAAVGTRVVLVFHGRGLGQPDEHLLGADGYVVLHEEAAAELVELGVDPELVTVMQPSVNTDLFTAATELPAEPIAGYIGRLEESKGALELPRVLAAVPEARVEAIGFGTPEQRAALNAQARLLGVDDRLALLGELTPPEVAARMRRWRLLLVPSHSEGSPIVVAEAAAARIPVAVAAGVLAPSLEQRPGVHAAPRAGYPMLAARLLVEGVRPPATELPDHRVAGAAWDALLESLPPWRPRAPVQVSRTRRVRRLRPIQRLRKR